MNDADGNCSRIVEPFTEILIGGGFLGEGLSDKPYEGHGFHATSKIFEPQ